MATNPMQRKARNSFLLGMLLMLVIAGVVIAFLFMQLMNKTKKEKEELQALVKAYVLTQDVSSGQIITKDMLQMQSVNRNMVPSNAISNIETIENYALQDKEGNDIGTLYDEESKNYYLYMRKDNKNYVVEKETETDNYYMPKIDETNYICIKKDESKKTISFYVENNESQTIKKDNSTGEYYIENNNSRRTTIDIEKKYIQLNSVPLVAKIQMKKNTPITIELLSKSDNIVQDDVRKQEYNMLVLPMDLVKGDYIDIRLMLPSGQDYIVVAKKEVDIPQVSGTDVEDTIWMNLSEDEILHMSCAIIDAYQIKGSKLYVTKYTEAGMQEAATPTYPINASTTKLLINDPNILEKAMNAIKSRYGADKDTNGANDSAEFRDDINDEISRQGEQTQSNIESNMQESITNSRNSRKEYLDSLAGVVQ